MRLDELSVNEDFYVTSMPELQGTVYDKYFGCVMVRWRNRKMEEVHMEGQDEDGKKWSRHFTPKAGGKPVSISRGTEVTRI